MRLFTLALLFFGLFASAQTADDFVFTVDLTIRSSANYRFNFSTSNNISIDWGDGQQTNYTSGSNQSAAHSFASNGVYTVIVNGPLDSFEFYLNDPISITQWGNSIFQTMRNAFEYCQNLSINALDVPDLSQVTNMSFMFRFAINFDSDISNWDVSNVIDMTEMFKGAYSFNSDISSWDVSSVSEMNDMFQSARLFNQPLNSWDVSGARTLSGMFTGANNFNQPLHSWDVSNITWLSYLFFGASSFNQDLSSWDFNQNSNIRNFIHNSGLDVYNYDALLRKFVEIQVDNVDLGLTYLEYCDSFSRNQLINRGWTILNDSEAINCTDQTLTGSVKFDHDSNGCSASDFEANGLAIRVSNATDFYDFYTQNGIYNSNLRPGIYTVTPLIDSQRFNVSPTSANVNITSNGLITQDFCISTPLDFDAVDLTILPVNDARPGFDASYKLIYTNTGTITFSGTIELDFEDNYLDFMSANPAPNAILFRKLTWDFSNLNPFETQEIELNLNLNTPTDLVYPLNINDVLDFEARLSHNIPNNTPSDAIFSLEQIVVNSFDPNDKSCLQGETILPTMVGEYVHYRIRFENEGTASAVNVRIVDYIDTSKFDIATLTPLSGSHDYLATITEGNKVEFLFDNINLPFTAPASQGYVLFKIKTLDTLVLGDDFSNQAEIYFDFNFPIITNLETTAVAVPLSLNESNLFQASLFPNPAQNSISVKSNLEFHQYTIYNTLGAVVSEQKLESPSLSHHIQVNNLVSGLYFVELRGDQGSFVVKMIKE
ncbi:BspA family leucine-rich repeat surface protein [Nonlabens sp. Ci31]|uniref:BspA family leucine-rich repeat surface protein n=1 Tax=Nonlabens sp. Ci31 TaxID=2608253 RepID=UPI001463DA90|nr:BspA family leucine-rich repeat surface protein [Nonlabens sp. Ci31]QJP34221.1 BspA family leucine-rich repeat surface protein [Nonlabens sp. Ci31]